MPMGENLVIKGSCVGSIFLVNQEVRSSAKGRVWLWTLRILEVGISTEDKIKI